MGVKGGDFFFIGTMVSDWEHLLERDGPLKRSFNDARVAVAQEFKSLPDQQALEFILIKIKAARTTDEAFDKFFAFLDRNKKLKDRLYAGTGNTPTDTRSWHQFVDNEGPFSEAEFASAPLPANADFRPTRANYQLKGVFEGPRAAVAAEHWNEEPEAVAYILTEIGDVPTEDDAREAFYKYLVSNPKMQDRLYGTGHKEPWDTFIADFSGLPPNGNEAGIGLPDYSEGEFASALFAAGGDVHAAAQLLMGME